MIRTAAAKPLLLPFIYGGTKSEASAAKKRYGVVLKAPAKEAHILETIDQAMELRERHARKTD
jgi:hypothetical protein